MSFKVFDYTCQTCEFTEERFVTNEDIQADNERCPKCFCKMIQQMPTPKGYVRGTLTPRRY